MVAPPPWLDGGKPLLRFLLELARDLDTPMVTYPCGDDYVWFLSEHQNDLSESFLFMQPDQSTLEQILNKATFATLAGDLGIHTPWSSIINGAPGLSLPENVQFPIVAKAISSLKSNPFWGKLRVRQFDTLEEWDHFFSPFKERSDKVIVQEMIPGDDSNQYVYEGLWREDSVELCGFTVKKTRQQPKGYGSSCKAVLQPEPKVLESARTLLGGIRYKGLADIDFKRDARNGVLYAMEINPRLGGVHRVSGSCGLDLVRMLYWLLSGVPVTPIETPANRQYGCPLSKDLRSVIPEIAKKPLATLPWLRSYWPIPKDALFEWYDPWPWLTALGHVFSGAMREVKSWGKKSPCEKVQETPSGGEI
jgi:predicted ATP-grasp superfamily ATP-dependent carboligase